MLLTGSCGSVDYQYQVVISSPLTVCLPLFQIISATGRSRLSADECSLFLVAASEQHDFQEWSADGGLVDGVEGRLPWKDNSCCCNEATPYSKSQQNAACVQ